MVLAEDLRQAVLQAALQGKLTEQLETDSDVDEMLKNIQEEKNSLIANKKIKKEKPMPEIQEEDIPFDIPNNWRWIKTGDICDCGAGATPPRTEKSYYDNGVIPWLKTGELTDGYIYKCEEKVTQLALDKCSLRVNQKNDILVAMYGATIGKLGIVTFPLTTNQACCGCTPYKGIYNLYLFYCFMAFKKILIGKAEGGAQPNISREKIRNLIIPLPSIEEQQRIVDKINETMPKIDEYEKIEKELEALKKQFPNDMKDALLQAAMQGKLTEQLESDSGVDELLQEIEKKELKSSKWKAKKEFEIDEILDIIDTPIIPNNWKWVKLSNIAFSNIGLTYKPSDKTVNGIIVLRSSNIQNGRMDYNDIVKVNMTIPDNKMCDIGDILMCVRNGSKSLVGKVAVIDKSNMSFGAFMSIIKSRCNQFLYYFFNSNMFKKQMHINSSTETINQITQDMLFNCVIPLPPIEEQDRIVERLDVLLPLCEDLKE